jgi:DNA topoisomerase-1
MAEKVVIVESKAKARTISRYLGKGYEVRACMGHVRDLPEDEFGVDVENEFEPTYRVMPGSRRVVGQLRKATKEAVEVYLAPDPDREGEAIAWHLKHALKLPDERTRRVTFNEITRDAVREAFRRPRGIDRDLVDAQQARRILDRIVGYELSPLISRKVVRGLSAGRVQSVALRLIVERERERDAFEPEEYWQITARLSAPGDGETFEAELKELDGEELSIPDEARATELVERLAGETYRVSEVKERTTSSKASPPFITSTLQQVASSRLRLSAAQTMRIAQQLYEGVDVGPAAGGGEDTGAAGEETMGLITYMRTDSTRVADQALQACRRLIGDDYGDAYLPKKPNTFRSPRGAQAAHEAIRPTDPARRPEEVRPYLSERQFKLYDLIWRRFVASQMTPARYRVTDVAVEAGPALFRARGRRMLFDGHTRVLSWRDGSEEQALPELDEGDELDLEELVPSQHFTQPPPRYTEASLVRELEKQGIGRPSTYAPTIQTLLRRNYVRRVRRAFHPTDLGIVVTDLLVEHFPREMDVSFTSRMEEELDEIETGQRDWRATLGEFYEQFSADLAEARQNMERVAEEEPPEPVECEECGRPMVIKFSRGGDRFLGCSGFPECTNTRSLPGAGREEAVETEYKCDKCGAPMLRRVGRRGREYLACSAFPECRNIMGLDKEGKPVKLAPRQGTGFSCPRCGARMHVAEGGEADELTCGRCRNRLPKLTVEEALHKTEMPGPDAFPPCPECGADMELKRSRKGLFLGCSNYPDCKGTSSLPKELLPAPQPTHENCEKCGRPMLVRWGKYGRFLACSGFPGCRNSWKLPSRPKDCPVEGCDGHVIKKTGPDGEQYRGCTRYPDCDYREPLAAEKKGR